MELGPPCAWRCVQVASEICPEFVPDVLRPRHIGVTDLNVFSKIDLNLEVNQDQMKGFNSLESFSKHL